MWTIETRWFDVAMVTSLLAVGNILFGHFEQHKPSWRRLLKVPIVLAIVLALVQTVGRGWGYGVLVLPALGVVYLHLLWLPKHGINGWTGEPRDKYLALLTRYGDNLFSYLMMRADRVKSGREDRPGESGQNR